MWFQVSWWVKWLYRLGKFEMWKKGDFMFEDLEKMVHKGLTRCGRESLYSYYLGVFDGSVSSRIAWKPF